VQRSKQCRSDPSYMRIPKDARPRDMLDRDGIRLLESRVDR